MLSPTHTITTTCSKCGTQLSTANLTLPSCPVCAVELAPRQDAIVRVAPLPPVFGSVK